ncbi:MAG: DNA helicase [Spirulina sp. DLM2.Bin59]|nr:MAG: DNA helicase [Spirulina sp. DLM2.Bin59]
MPLENLFNLAVSDEFLDSLSRLPQKIQGQVSKFIRQFKNNPTATGINYETIQNSRNKNIRSVRINQEYRAIILKPDVGNTYLLLWVDHHDRAYAWAERKNCIVNSESGALQIVDVESVTASIAQFKQKNSQQQSNRFQQVKDKHLMRLGVPEILLPALRQVVTDQDVDDILMHLPSEAKEAVFLLASGYSIEQVFQELDKPETAKATINPHDIDQALQNEETLTHFTVITDDRDLEKMLAAPLEKWRVFLHPSQRKLVNRNWEGAVRVLGGAGTGKTVVAIHRAIWLAKHYLKSPHDQIFFTTFTKNLAVDIKTNLKTICPPEHLKQIHVINLDAWVTQFFRQEGVTFKITYEQNDELWQDAYSLAPSSEWTLDFYREEWRDVVLTQDCQTEREYLKARRVGRGTRLSRQQRKEIWPVFEEYRNLLLAKNFREPDEAFREAARLIRQRGSEYLPFRAVVVDEAQDMSMAAFELLRAIAGDPHPNDLFIVGDAHQRIYGKTVVLSRCGIEVRGRRSRKLRLNYRTTEETRIWATAILSGQSVDDLDGGIDTLTDYRSLMHGEAPIVQGFETFDQEMQFIIEKLKYLQQKDEKLSSVGIVLRTQGLIDKIEAALIAAQIPVHRIKRSQPDDLKEVGVRLGSMHRVKGLQFNYIFLPLLTAQNLPLKSDLARCFDEVSRERQLLQERSLLHVAATRAKQQVIVSYHGQGCPFLTEIP